MARARNIKPGFFRNADLVELSMEARLLFIGLWTIADRSGRLEDRPKQIKMEIFPADNVDCDACLRDLASTGMVVRYEVAGKRYLQVTNFSRHQNPHRDEKTSTLPDECGNYALSKQEQVDNGSSTMPAPCKQDAGMVVIGLIPDSLIPEVNLKPPALRDGPLLGSPKPKAKGQTLLAWLAEAKAKGEKAVSGYEPLWAFCDKSGLPTEWIEIAWAKFVERYSIDEKGRVKRYADWRRVFLRAVEENWLNLWFWSDKDGQYRLTTVGFGADLATREAA